MTRRPTRCTLFPYTTLFLSRTSDCSTIFRIPDSNGAVVGCRGDVPPIGRVSNGSHPPSVPLERISDCSTSLRIPDSNGGVGGSGDDMAPIRRVRHGQDGDRKRLERGTN